MPAVAWRAAGRPARAEARGYDGDITGALSLRRDRQSPAPTKVCYFSDLPCNRWTEAKLELRALPPVRWDVALSIPSVSFVNLKGGVGKTALTVNLAYALAEWHDYNVLVVDVDPQFNATQHLLDEKQIVAGFTGGTIKDILDPPAPVIQTGKPKKAAKHNPRDALVEVTVTGGGTLHLLPSLLDLSFVNRNPQGKEGRLEQFLTKVESDFDIILLDCPPTISILSHAAFNASRYYMVPVTPDYFAPIGIPLLEEEVDYFLSNLHAPTGTMVPLGLAYTLVDQREHVDWRSVANRIEKNTKIKPFSTHFPASKYWKDCAGEHKPVYKMQNAVDAKQRLEDFTKEFLARLSAEEEAEKS